MKKLKVGLVGLMHRNFTGDKEGQYNRSVKEMQELSKELDFEFYYVKNGIITDDEAWEARKEMEAQKVDLLMIQSTSFAAGTLISILARIDAYIGLWSVPEPAKEGKLQFNSFCGVNMNASIIGEYLKEYDIPFKWFYGNKEDKFFINRFRITIKSLTAIKNLKSAKVALIGGIANGFDNQYFDERKLEKRFGTKLYRNHEFSEIKDRALSYKTEDVIDVIKRMENDSCSISKLAKENLEKSARVFQALADFKKENNYEAIAVSCWPKFRLEMEMVACSTIGQLNYENMVTACEGDVYGMITMLAMRYMSDLPTLLMDLSDLDENDNSVLMWHCGIGCKNLAYQGKVWMEPHCNPGPLPGKGMVLAAPVSEMVYAKQKATTARFTKEGDELFLLTGEFNNPDKPSFDGSRGWLGDLHLNGEPIGVIDLMNTIIVQQMQHHYAVASGDLHEEMLEVAAWLGIKPVEKVPYKNYLQMR
jgi:L-fucose isomerase-like protein